MAYDYSRNNLSNFVKSQGGNLETLGQAPSYTGAPSMRGTPPGGANPNPMAQQNANPNAGFNRMQQGMMPQGAVNQVQQQMPQQMPVQQQMPQRPGMPIPNNKINAGMAQRMQPPNTRMQNMGRMNQRRQMQQQQQLKRQRQMQRMNQRRSAMAQPNAYGDRIAQMMGGVGGR